MLDLYAFGMLAAHLLAGREKAPRHWLYGLGALAFLAGMVWVMWAQNPVDGRDVQRLQLMWRLPLAALGSGFLWCGGQIGPGLSRAVGNPVVRFLSAISYNFYIWHQYLAVKLKEWHIPAYSSLSLPQQYEGPLWQKQYTAVCFLAALALAAAVTYLWEKPLARRGLGKKRQI